MIQVIQSCAKRKTSVSFSQRFLIRELTSIKDLRDITLLSYCVYLLARGTNCIEISYYKTRDTDEFSDIRYDALFSTFTMEVIPICLHLAEFL